MCGLFGFNSLKDTQPYLEKAQLARDTLTHRGPDQAGEWYNKHVYMGHRRLSILDLSEAGQQPMLSADKNVIITVNGEVYNFKELRSELESLGASFSSASDSEVILHGYRYWGIQVLLEKIDGMYAFSIYDVAAAKLYLARDRTGIKPLYYGTKNGLLGWASELKALTSFYGRSNLTLDNTALYDFLTYRYIPAPKTCYTEIRKLPPAHILTLDVISGAVSIERYWQLAVGNLDISDDEAAQRLNELLAESVNEQMVADVPVGFFLSGGIDSSAITAHARQLNHETHTYSIGFGVPGHDETTYAEQVAKHLGTQHQTNIISAHLDKPFSHWLIDLYDEPFADNSALPTWYVAQFARNKATVVLTGDGGDELFGGYKWYQALPKLEKLRCLLRFVPKKVWVFVPKNIARLLQAISAEADIFNIVNSLYLTKVSPSVRKKYRQILGIPDSYDDMWFFRQYWRRDLPLRKAMQYVDFHTFMPEDVLTKVDRATMAHSLEARVPFLSRKLIEFAFQLPERFLYKNGQLKGGLKYASRHLLPEEILHRPKQGFSVPIKHWQTDLGTSQDLSERLLSIVQKQHIKA